MKYPKLWNGPTAIGESQVRQLSGLDMPFAQKFGEHSQSFKKNGFNEVYQDIGAPYLWGRYVVVRTPSNQVLNALLSPEDHIGYTVLYKSLYTTTPGGFNTEAFPFAVFVGDNYIAVMECDSTDTDGASTKFWPSIVRADALGAEFLSTQSGHERHTITYIDTAQLSGLGRPIHRFSLWATGWDGDETSTKRFRWGLTCTSFTDSAHPDTTRFPVSFTGSTGDYTLTQVAFPAFVGRDHHSFNTFCAGPGKLQALNFVSGTPLIDPYLSHSEDHGDSWTADSVAWLAPFLARTYPALTGVQVEGQLVQMAFFTTITYVGKDDGGNDTTMLMVPNGYDNATSQYCPMLFIGNGTTYARLSWPPDAWFTDYNGAPIAGIDSIVGITAMQEARSAQFGFGRGCLFVPVLLAGLWHIMFTRDFGATWATSAAVPLTLTGGGADISGVLVKPYVAAADGFAAKPGRIIFPAPDYTRDQLRFFETDGNFARFTDLGAVVKPKGAIYATGIDSNNYCYVNYGGRKYPPYVFPAFPGEFDKP